jgi:glycosyltransferase involved in cell wall biosynthesis
VRVVTVTTSYPRHEDDWAGRFVADAVERLRGAGVEVDVVAPGAYKDFGLAYGDGVPANARRRPWAVPGLLGSLVRATRRAAAHADVVHAHWLPAGLAAAASGKPFVVTLHGTDVELAKRLPSLARPVLRRAAGVIAVSSALARDAAGLGARRIYIIPNGVELPADPGLEREPPSVLFVGRLSPEKGVEELLAAAEGMPVVYTGDGPLRARVPGALGFVTAEELGVLYRGAAVVACPSRREGFGMACAEAMAHGKPVVASRIGGLLDLVTHERTGLLVAPGDVSGLRAALERLLRDRELRHRLGAAGRAHVAEYCSWERVTRATMAVYREALQRPGRRPHAPAVRAAE